MYVGFWIKGLFATQTQIGSAAKETAARLHYVTDGQVKSIER